MFSGMYARRRVLVTGHTGFKGSWLCMWLASLGAQVRGFALDPDTSPSHWDLLGLREIDDVRGDLRDPTAVEAAIRDWKPEIVFHLAAQPLVRRSYREPVATFETNVMGLVHVLEAIRKTPSVRVFVNATTDKVYADGQRPAGYLESDPLGGHDPYSTSKACAELVTESYRKSFLAPSIHVSTARAGNVIGGGDWAEDRLVPDIVRAVTAKTALDIRNPSAVRPWQHVLEPLSGYLRLGQALFDGEVTSDAWNFGPSADANLPVSGLIDGIRQHWPELSVALSPGPHPHEAETLRLNCHHAAEHLGWIPVWGAAETIRRTVAWYGTYLANGTVASQGDLDAYALAARERGLSWAE
jgi:CDP-glucose 4,6-dehydratase